MRPNKPGAVRSVLMGRVRQKGTAAELAVAVALREQGHAYRLNVRALPGSPDFANRKRRWAIFVHGCFWHQHRACKRATIPKANRAFWREKFAANRRRDARAIRDLRRAGYRVAIIWECQSERSPELCERLSKIFETRRVGVCQPVDHGGVVVDVSRLRRG